jgi:hypothetical protein
VYATWSGAGTVALALASNAVYDAAGNLSAAAAQSERYTLVEPTAGASTSSFVTVTISVNGANGGTAVPLGDIQVPRGESTNVVATANDWYRIGSLTANSTPVSSAAGQKQYTLYLTNLLVDTTVAVTFTQPASMTNFASLPATWFTNWGHAEVEYQSISSNTLSLAYLLNADPTTYTTNKFEIVSIAMAPNTIKVMSSLSVNGVTNSRTINGVLNVDAANRLTNVLAFTNRVKSVTNATFGSSGRYESVFTDTATQRFYRIRLERTP